MEGGDSNVSQWLKDEGCGASIGSVLKVCPLQTLDCTPEPSAIYPSDDCQHITSCLEYCMISPVTDLLYTRKPSMH